MKILKQTQSRSQSLKQIQNLEKNCTKPNQKPMKILEQTQKSNRAKVRNEPRIRKHILKKIKQTLVKFWTNPEVEQSQSW